MDSSILARAFNWAKSAAFAGALPPSVRQWAPLFINAGRMYGVNPWVLAGICYRESRGGDALTPKGPAGTGDFTPRGSGSTYFRFANPATGLPPDGKGWGRGIMQLDFGAENAWVTSHDWTDPQASINRAAEILAGRLAFFASQPFSAVAIQQWRIDSGIPKIGIAPWRTKYPRASWPTSAPDPRPLAGAALQAAAVASYNAGTSGVLQALALGLPPDAPTAGQDYVSWFLRKISEWSVNF